MTRIPNYPTSSDPKNTFEDGDGLPEPKSMSLNSISGMSDGALGIENFDSDESAGKRDYSKITQHGAFVIVVAGVVALAVLGGMRLLQSRVKLPAFDSSVAAKVDQALLKVQSGYAIGTASAGDAGEPIDIDVIRDTLTHEPQQVEIEYVQKNPFVLPVEPKKAQQVAQTDPYAAQREEERKKRLLMREAREYHIDMVMAGTEGNAAVIDGEVRHVGDRLGSFQIETIDAAQVMLRADKYRFRLPVGQ